MANRSQSASSTSYRVVIERLSGVNPNLPRALLSVVQEFTNWQPTVQLQYVGTPPQSINVTEARLATYLAEVKNARAHGIPAIFRLGSTPDLEDVALFFDVEPTTLEDIEYVWFSLSPTLVADGALQLARLLNAVAAMSQGFGAYHSHIEEEGLLLLYRGARSAERARAALPPELRAYVPEPAISPQLAARFAQLLVPQEFDRRRVPDAIWWVNFWDSIQVETVGRDRIQTAEWENIVELPDGALVLVATEEPTDIANPTHVERLYHLVEHLNLPELQSRFRHKGHKP